MIMKIIQWSGIVHDMEQWIYKGICYWEDKSQCKEMKLKNTEYSVYLNPSFR